jgi:hypothetical protein
MNVSQIYDGDGEPAEMKIELEETASPKTPEPEGELRRSKYA